MNEEVALEISRLEPFGAGNPEPFFLVRRVRLSDMRSCGNDGSHLLMTVGGIQAIWWKNADRIEELRRNSSKLFDVVFSLEISEYSADKIRLTVQYAAPSLD
jgi:single-stranded-DNA-specific exonuclease